MSKPIAVITGASAGIGSVYADRLAARGFDLIVVARRLDRLEQLSTELGRKYGTSVEAIAADLSDENDLQRVEDILRSNRSIRLLVNNAGLSRLGPLSRASVTDANVSIALNIVSLTRLTMAVLPNFIARDNGTIINIASILALHALPVSGIYSGTKAYVLAFSRSLQDELAETNVKVQIVLPAATATEIWETSGIPLGSLPTSIVMKPTEMVDAALAGLDRNENVTLPSLEDIQLWEAYDTSRRAAFDASQTKNPASRYQE